MNLAQLQHLYTHDGPFVSLHLDVTRDAEDAQHQIEAAWAKERSTLAEAGAADSILDQLGELVTQPTHLQGEVRRTVVADDHEILFDDIRAGHGAKNEVATRGPLPDLSGWLAQVDGEVPFILVLADREGADIAAYRAWSRPEVEHEDVQGSSLHITKVPLGGWSHKRFQRRAEEVWRANADEVAEAVRHLWAQYKPRVVIVAGEVRARAEVLAALNDGGDLVTEEVEGGGRAAGSSDEAVSQDALAVLAQLRERDREQIVDALGAAAGQGTSVARGLPDVVGALVQGRVERLLVDLDAAATQTVDQRDYPGLGLPGAASEAGRLRADQVLVAAGASTDTSLSLLPADLLGGEGIAALLRWS